MAEHPPLPGLLGDLARAGHLGAALTLAREWGGRRRYIPKQPREGMEIVRLIGLEAALVLADLYGNEERDIPLCAQPGAKKAKILATPGPAGIVAALVGTTERHVRRVRNAGRPDDPDQGNLF